ncbi:hypothetical protein F6453_3550 [Marinobacter nauticus]|uniref:PEP-CTERM sorting domain-containing protein n=2 Tax=Marinobacter nauticus TaxID=2743 RepID=A0A833JP49_MARNT|nr:hypothetical protein F6453_3550 [Marinobacter nauticus]
MVLQAGFTLNEWDFPPRSGTNVVVDNSGAIELLFSNPISKFSAFITYITTLNVNAYNSQNMLLGQLVSLTNDNTFFSGNNPNEIFSFDIKEGISRILIEGDIDGDSFVMDDISFELADHSTPPIHDVPEPSTGGLALLSLILLWRKWRCERVSSDSAIKKG